MCGLLGPEGSDAGLNRTALGRVAPCLLLMASLKVSEMRSSQGYIVELLQTLIDQQTWSDAGSVSERVLRSYLLLFACVRNHQPCVEKASMLFHSWKVLDGNMRSASLHPNPLVNSSLGSHFKEP